MIRLLMFVVCVVPSLLQHEAVKIEMASKQHELDAFSSRGKQLLSELLKTPDCDIHIIKKDMDTLVDQWLDVRLTSGVIIVVLRYF